MDILGRETAPRYKRDDVTSYLLVSERTTGSQKLTVTLVEMAPGGIQHLHAHEPEQAYYILEGRGTMTVDGERKTVQAGDSIFFDSFAEHGLENTGDGTLRYLSTASPSFTAEESERLWPLPSLREGSDDV